MQRWFSNMYGMCSSLYATVTVGKWTNRPPTFNVAKNTECFERHKVMKWRVWKASKRQIFRVVIRFNEHLVMAQKNCGEAGGNIRASDSLTVSLNYQNIKYPHINSHPDINSYFLIIISLHKTIFILSDNVLEAFLSNTYSLHLFFTFILYSYSLLLFFTLILYSYSLHLFFTLILYSYSVLLFCTVVKILYSINGEQISF